MEVISNFMVTKLFRELEWSGSNFQRSSAVMQRSRARRKFFVDVAFSLII